MTDAAPYGFADVPREVLARFPELANEYRKLERLFDDERNGYFVWSVIGAIFWPYLAAALAADDVSILERAMAFVEELAAHRDKNVRSLVAVEVVYRLLGRGNEALLRTARSLMGPSTQELLRQQKALIESVLNKKVHWADDS